MNLGRALLLTAVLLLTGACATVIPTQTPAPVSATDNAPAPVNSSARAGATGTVNAEVTFYGGLDNDPPGSTDIAHPNGRHAAAGGTGTYADPITLATDTGELPPGTITYLPTLSKYFVMEDDCAECDTDWSSGHHPHVDLWMAPAGTGLLTCEQQLTPDAPVAVQVNPPADLPVDPQPLYDPATGRCGRSAT